MLQKTALLQMSIMFYGLTFTSAFIPNHYYPTSVSSWGDRTYQFVSSSPTKNSVLHLAKKKKESFAEKQRRRAERRLRQTSAPPIAADLKKFDNQKGDTDTSDAGTAVTIDKVEGEQDESTIQRAKEVIEAQRQSVKMLTHVRECVEGLPYDEVNAALDSQGYYVVDNFFKDKDLISALEQESRAMLESDQMEFDMLNGGTGEYIASVKGGEEQYTVCPRTVEMVVSVSKHMPKLIGGDTPLDDSVSMATMRTFDRKKLLAAMALLTGDNSEKNIQNLPPRSFGTVIEGNEPNESRKITLYYYPLPMQWDESCGAGIIFQGEDKNEVNVTVEAKRDRLVILKSDTCVHSKDAWKGKEGLEVGSCMELHFVSKNLA